MVLFFNLLGAGGGAFLRDPPPGPPRKSVDPPANREGFSDRSSQQLWGNPARVTT